jgi:hypothetical protein
MMQSLEQFKAEREAQLALNFKKEWERFAKAAEFKPEQETQMLTLHEFEVISESFFRKGYYAAFEDARFMAAQDDLED